MSHHLRWSAAAVLSLGLVGVVQQLHLFAGTESTEVSVSEAQERYDASTSSSVVAATTVPATSALVRLPAPGVYTYATTGRDSVDALTGAHHDYPAITTITVTSTACGVSERWDVLEQRWEEWQRCDAATAEGIDETGRTTSDQFFGQTQTDVWACTGEPRPVDAAAGTAWSATCTSADTTESRAGVVIGRETQMVGTTEVDALHVRTTVAGATSTDSQVVDTWYLLGTDLVVAQTSTVATSNASQVGTVHYAETYEIHLTSIAPVS